MVYLVPGMLSRLSTQTKVFAFLFRSLKAQSLECIKGTSNKTLLAACFYFFYFKAQAESKK